MIAEIVEQILAGLGATGIVLALTFLLASIVVGSVCLCTKVYENSKVKGAGLALVLVLMGILALSYFIGGA